MKDAPKLLVILRCPKSKMTKVLLWMTLTFWPPVEALTTEAEEERMVMTLEGQMRMSPRRNMCMWTSGFTTWSTSLGKQQQQKIKGSFTIYDFI